MQAVVTHAVELSAAVPVRRFPVAGRRDVDGQSSIDLLSS